jgi:hypothetical protein
LLKLSTVIRFFKAVRIFGVLSVVAYFAGFGPSQVLNSIKSQFDLSLTKENAAIVAKPTVISTVTDSDVTDSEEGLCLPMGERDRKALLGATGADVIRFLEQSMVDLHRAKSAEDQLKVIALHFDHVNWSKAWNAEASSGESLLQKNLSHASMVLARYNRLLENGRRQEASALKAFHWQEEVREEIHREPVRILVQSFLPYKCSKTDASYYGCAPSETIYRVKSLMSPRIACRFKDKRDQYAVVYWIRVKDGQPKILEVDAKGHRLVKVTYEELEYRKLRSALSPNVADVLQSAGLDPFRAGVLWRQMNRGSDIAVDPSRVPAATNTILPPPQVTSEFQTDSY